MTEKEVVQLKISLLQERSLRLQAEWTLTQGGLIALREQLLSIEKVEKLDKPNEDPV